MLPLIFNAEILLAVETISSTPSKSNALSVFTVAVTVLETAPVDVTEITPLEAVVEELINLTKTLVELNEPALSVSDKVELYVPPEAFEISNPVGAVTVTLAPKLVPATVNACGVIDAPEHDAKVFSVPVIVIVGDVTVKL
jgi:hypothetical protein